MTSLAAYQLRIADALRDPSDPLPGAEVIRWSIRNWSRTQLGSVAPLTCALLALRGRLDAAIELDLQAPDRPGDLHGRGRRFLARLARTPPGLDGPVAVADVALLEWAMTAPPEHRPVLPDPWLWRRDPLAVCRAILAGVDPADLPAVAVPVLIRRDSRGRLSLGSSPTS